MEHFPIRFPASRDKVVMDFHPAAQFSELTFPGGVRNRVNTSERTAPARDQNRFSGSLGLSQQSDALCFELRDDDCFHDSKCDLVSWPSQQLG